MPHKIEFGREFKNMPFYRISECDSDKTAVIVIDMINGFLKHGKLHDSKGMEIVPHVKKLLEYAAEHKLKSVAFADCHSRNSVEFELYPKHCVRDTDECEVIDELSASGSYRLIHKNSTNGFHAPQFRRFLDMNGQLDSFIVCGVNTDICVMSFCMTLKTYFDSRDRKSRVILPMNMTYTSSGDSVKNAACLFMENYGIELFGGIDFD